MDRELLRLRRSSRIASFSLPLSPTTAVCVTRLSQEHDDQVLTNPDPVAHLVALHIAWQSFAASTHEFHPTGGRDNVSSVHLKSDLYIVGIKVTYVTPLVAAFPDLKQSALQVVLQLAWTPMKALCSESNSDVTSCSDVTSVFVHSKTPLHRREQAPVFWSCVPPLFGTSCWNFVLSLCTLQLLSIQSPVDPACSRSIIFSPPQSSQGSRTSSWWSRPLAMLSSCVAPSSESCRQIRFLPRSPAAK